MPVGEEAEVADAHEAAWQQVEQEAAQELIDRESHDPLLVAVGGVAPAKDDFSVGESNQPAFWAMPVSARVVRDGGMSAVRALIAMSTQRGGSAACDG